MTPGTPSGDGPVDPSDLVWTDGLDRLREQCVGPVMLGTAEAAGAEVAGFNLAVTHRPVAVVGAANAQDVVAAVRWATEHGLGVAVQATGHGAIAPVTEALLVSTRRMDQVNVDPTSRRATFGAGVRWHQVVEAAAPYGLTPLVGSTQQVGAVGYTLGGGLGLFGRKHGFAADWVRSLQIVTADGVLRDVDADHHADLFWAVRGGKGSFGIVTSLTVELVPVAAFWGGPVFFAGSHAREVLHAYRAWAPTLPEEATSSIALLRVPPLPDIPEPIRGQFVVHLRYAHCGDPAEAERLLAPMLAAGPVLMGGGGPTPVLSSDVVHQDPHDPLPFWDHGALLSELSPEVVDRLLAKAGPQVDVPLILVELRQLGGALSREADVPNAVAGRDAEYSLFVLGVMAPGLQEVVPALCAALVDSVAEWTTGGSLVNFLGAAATTPERVCAAWSPDVLERLHKVKDSWDPDNVFRFGHALR